MIQYYSLGIIYKLNIKYEGRGHQDNLCLACLLMRWHSWFADKDFNHFEDADTDEPDIMDYEQTLENEVNDELTVRERTYIRCQRSGKGRG